MKRRLHKKYLILILAYSGLLLLIPYVLDYRDKSAQHAKLPQQQPRCPDLENTVALLWDNGYKVNGSDAVEYAVNRSQSRIHIYLHATWRTGSSFLGELFNQHPDVFYLYEPMWHIWQALYPGDAGSLQGAVRDMMNALYRCDFSVLKLYAGSQNITTSFIFGWKMNKVICSEPMCDGHKRHEIGLVKEEQCAKCQKRDLRELERECKKYPVMVIKGVRVLDLSTLVPLMRDPAVNLQIIQLFRDPRAVHNSRLKSKQALVKESIQVLRSKKQTDKYKRLLVPSNRMNRAESYVSSAMELICDNWLSDMMLVVNSPPWVRRNYLRIRYEDLVLHPMEELQRLYRFSNLSTFPALEKFALNMTHGQGYSSDKPFLISSRDAKEAIYAWRERLNVEQISQVEAYCSEVMRQLGVLVFTAEGKRWNDKTSCRNVVHKELTSVPRGLFSFTRVGSTNWRKSERREQPIAEGCVCKEEKAAYFYSVETSRVSADRENVRGINKRGGWLVQPLHRPASVPLSF